MGPKCLRQIVIWRGHLLLSFTHPHNSSVNAATILAPVYGCQLLSFKRINSNQTTSIQVHRLDHLTDNSSKNLFLFQTHSSTPTLNNSSTFSLGPEAGSSFSELISVVSYLKEALIR